MQSNTLAARANKTAAAEISSGNPIHDHYQNQLLLECEINLASGKLKLPSIPDISLKIRRAVQDEKANNLKIARVVQIDPAMTARLVQIANSPLYRGRKTVESCPEAITRLGLRATQDLVTSFALKSVFNTKSKLLQQQMHDLWDQSSYVAAICAVIAQKTPGFDPDRAMLAGLIHNIGVVPVLTYADQHQLLASDAEKLEQTITHLREKIGAMIVTQWGFPTDFIDVVKNCRNWNRDTKPNADYTDLVMVSILHSYIGTGQVHHYPIMDTLPAYRKLATGKLDAGLSKNILDTAKDEIHQIQQMLSL